MTKKNLGNELTVLQVKQLTEVVASPHPDAINLLVQKALNALFPKEWHLGNDVQESLADNQDFLNLICALGPRDVAEVMLISQFVVLQMKGMKSFHNGENSNGIEFLKLSQETFELLNRYRGKKMTQQNINVTYNVVSDKTQINAKL